MCQNQGLSLFFWGGVRVAGQEAVVMQLVSGELPVSYQGQSPSCREVSGRPEAV